MKISTIIVDDEALSRRGIEIRLQSAPDFEVVAQCANGREALVAVTKHKPDVLFLDIQMPGMDGFGVVDALGDNVPRIIFVTAHDEYTLQALEIHAFDYLLKPFDQARFSKVLVDARREAEKGRQSELQASLRQLLEEVESSRNPRLLVEENGRGILIALNLIDWAEADRNYLKLHIGAQTYTVRGTLEGIEKKLDSERFLRINRSSLIRIDFIRELQKWTHGEYRILMQSGHTLMWTRRYLDRHSELLRKV